MTNDKPDKLKLPRFHCKRCGHRWFARKPYVPDACGRCKTRSWETAKTKEPSYAN